MSIGIACMVFQMSLENNLRSCLNDLFKRLRNIYIPGNKQRDSDLKKDIGGNYQLDIEKIDSYTRKIHVKQKTPSEQDKNFEAFIKEVNSVLFYLSNVEFQRSQHEGVKCILSEPVEVVLSITDIYRFREDLEKDYNQ